MCECGTVSVLPASQWNDHESRVPIVARVLLHAAVGKRIDGAPGVHIGPADAEVRAVVGALVAAANPPQKIEVEGSEGRTSEIVLCLTALRELQCAWRG